MPRHHETHARRLVAVLALGKSAAPESALAPELASLLEGLGYELYGTLRQRRQDLGSSLPVGSGKLAELRELIEAASLAPGDSVLVASAIDLSPGHLRNLEKALDVPVIDRTEVILRVFEERAASPLAKLEIERARLVHSLPRIRDTDAAQRQEGGGGRAAKGHSQTELAKRAALRRIAELGRKIDTLRGEQKRHVERRRGVPRVALVGYTNVGKSSWMEALTGRSVGVKDELFHTLGTRVHALRGEGARVLVADTVGFIEELPHTLVESFRSTLEEALDADLRLHVADASSPRLDAQIAVTREVIAGVNAPEARELLLLNKIDRLDAEQQGALRERYPDALFVSSRSVDDRKRLVTHLRALVAAPPPAREPEELSTSMGPEHALV